MSVKNILKNCLIIIIGLIFIVIGAIGGIATIMGLTFFAYYISKAIYIKSILYFILFLISPAICYFGFTMSENIFSYFS